MATEDEREIYRQRFESERSWYRLEWQIFQWGVVIGLVTLGLGEKAFSPQWWQFLISGAVFIKFSYAMQRISKGFRDNREILRVYASRVGDYIPKVSLKPLESAAVKSRLILHTAGVILVIVGVWNANCIPCWIPRLPLILKILVTLAMLVEWGLWIALHKLKTNYRTRWVSTSIFWTLVTTVTLVVIIVITCLVHHN